MLLYVAWFSFNTGSGGKVSDVFHMELAARAAVNTLLAASSSSVAGIVWNKLYRPQMWDVELNVKCVFVSCCVEN